MVACFILRTPRKMISPQPGDFYRIICYICGMENNNDISGALRDLAEKNPCIKFVIDNYDMLCIAHSGKVVMTVNSCLPGIGPEARVAKTFDSIVDAMMYADAIAMDKIPYALKECNGGDAMNNLIYSIGCKGV